jgi:hypothetical protein
MATIHNLTIKVVHKMATEQFDIQITTVPGATNYVMAMIVIGVVIIVTGLALGKLLKDKRQSHKKNC